MIKEEVFNLSKGQELKVRENEIVTFDKFGFQRTFFPIAIRHGVLPIQIDMYNIGINYQVDLLSSQGKKYVFKVKTYFGFKKKLRFQTYNSLIDCLYETFFDGLYHKISVEISIVKPVPFGNEYTLHHDKISITKWNKSIHFNDMKIDRKPEYFAINSIKDPTLYTNVYYLKTWNANLLLSLLHRRLP